MDKQTFNQNRANLKRALELLAEMTGDAPNTMSLWGIIEIANSYLEHAEQPIQLGSVMEMTKNPMEMLEAIRFMERCRGKLNIPADDEDETFSLEDILKEVQKKEE